MLFRSDETFFTCIGCMDGRVQNIVASYGKKEFDALFPDAITEAGMVGLLAKENIDEVLLLSLRHKLIDVSIGVHKSQGVIVHGHTKCAGNPVEDGVQKSDIRKSVILIQSLVAIPVIGLFVFKKEDGNWAAERLEVDSSSTK